jgi:hypothetical protein
LVEGKEVVAVYDRAPHDSHLLRESVSHQLRVRRIERIDQNGNPRGPKLVDSEVCRGLGVE